MATGANKRLRDALLACEELAMFTEGKSSSDYAVEISLQRIVERELEIIGEAINRALRIEPELVDAIPKALVIVGMRNRIAHGYDELNDDVIWDAVTVGVPALTEVLRALLDSRHGLRE
jgi:uncharacterized protein with HEPN domain